MITKCRVCSSKKLTKVLDLGMQPWCNHFLTKMDLGKEKKYPLILLFCNHCKISQLNFTVKKEIMFSNHTYLSGITKTLSNHFKKIAEFIKQKYAKNKKIKYNILDLGSNDGTFLKHFKKFKWDILGVESSSNICKLANSNNIPTINMFFNLKNSKKIKKKFSFINASGVFFHLEELHSFTKGVHSLLKEDGIFIVQFLYMKSIKENVAFDQIYHEHLLYYNLETLQFFLNKFNLQIFDCDLQDVHGGQMVCYITKNNYYKKTQKYINYLTLEKKSKTNTLKNYKEFAKKVIKLKKRNIKFLKKNEKSIIYGIGAPAKGNTLLNYFKINNNIIPLILEKNSLRFGLYTPGSHILIQEENKKNMDRAEIFFVLAWNFKKEILKNNKKYIEQGKKFYFPINIKK